MVKDKGGNDLGVDKTYFLIYYCRNCEKDMEVEVSNTAVNCSMEDILNNEQLHKETLIHKCCEGECGITRLVGIRDQQ